MIPIQIKITEYYYDKNVCKAKLQNGNIIEVDPFVGCAIPLTDEEYNNGNGAYLVGKSYILISYSVYPTHVMPHENGMIELS